MDVWVYTEGGGNMQSSELLGFEPLRLMT